MESRPPQEPPRRSAGGRKPNGAGGSPTPPWLWLLLIVGFALIFWQLSSKPETTVSYSPFFLDQVKKNNLKTLSIQGGEARGELREKQLYPSATMPNPSNALPLPISKFVTNFPSEQAINDVVNQLRATEEKLRETAEKASKPGQEAVKIDIQ